MATFTLTATTGTKYNKRVVYNETFESDNPLKDGAKLMSEVPHDILSYNTAFTITDEDGYCNETYVLSLKSNGDYFFHDGFQHELSEDEYPVNDSEPRYLTFIDPETNEYKYYTIIPNGNGTFDVDFGRIGQEKGTFVYISGANKDGDHHYPMNMFWIKYYEKISKGYVDQSEDKDFDKTTILSAEYKPIEEPEVNRLMSFLIERQRNYVSENFDVSVSSSMKAIEKAQDYLDKLGKLAYDKNAESKRDEIKSIYQKLVVTLPRKIPDVEKYIDDFSFDASAENYIGTRLENEKDLLDNFIDVYKNDHMTEGEVSQTKKADVLESNGLKAYRPTYDEQWACEDKLCGRTGSGNGSVVDESYLCSRVLCVENTRTTEKYENAKRSMGIKDKDCYLFFHGSRTENWWSIFKNGMSLNPNAVTTGKMFGQGLYFAPLARKSLGYTDFRGSHWSGGSSRFGYLALFDVAMGKPYETYSSTGSYFNFNSLPNGCQSTWAKAGAYLYNDECIVYREDQCNIRYLIEMDADRQPFRAFDQRKIRQMKCSSPYYGKRTDTIKVYCDLSKYAKTDEKYLTYDCKTDRVIAPQGLNLSKAELEYLTDVFKSNFAESPQAFKEILPTLKEKQTKTKDNIQKD